MEEGPRGGGGGGGGRLTSLLTWQNLIMWHTVGCVCQIKEPATIKETFTGDHGKQWKAAADLEFEALRDNQTWELVDLPDE